MKKRIGDIEIDSTANCGKCSKNSWHEITVHYNDSVNASISIRSYETLLDLEYAVKNAIRKVLESEE